MLHIILFILKILGYMLLTALSLCVIILLIALFVPVRYQLSGSYIDKPDLSAKITWLFGIVKAHVEFKEKHFRGCFKIAWKKLFDTDKAVKEVNRDNNMHKSEDQISEETKCSDMHRNDLEISNETSKIPESNTLVKKEESFKVDDGLDKTNQKPCFSKKRLDKKKPVSTKEKKSLFKRISIKIESILDKVEMTSEAVEAKLEFLSCKWSKIEKFISAECTKKSVELLMKMLKSILKHILPKDINGRIHYGMDKPSTTGRILGYASAFYPLYADNIQLEPDFEKSVIEGNLNLRGRIQMYIFAIWGLRLILSKDIRKLIKYMKHLKK